MSKSHTKSVFICQQCGKESPKWLGRCPDCGEWNSFVETAISEKLSSKRSLTIGSPPRELAQISKEELPRLILPFTEFNRVLGGGIVPGSLVLIGGDPGIGKSTLLLEVAAAISEQKRKMLYVSGEESAHQIKIRAERLGLDGRGIYILSETDLEVILERGQEMAPDFVIIDSIQSVYLEELSSAAGSVGQVRECTLRLMHWAKTTNIPIFIIGHVTKEGAIAGPRVLEHIVDVVLYLEGERFSSFRILRSVKNRFGSTDEVGIFEMQDRGLVEVSNPSQIFISQHSQEARGSIVVPTMEGTRPLLVEIQALTSPTNFSLPRRTANGVDFNRLLLIAAVLTRRAGINLSNQDIIVNVVGGLRVQEPAADLGIALAIVSSYRNLEIDSDLVAIGEIGLSGELRLVSQIEKRVSEAARLGFKNCLLPSSANISTPHLKIIPASSLSQALKLVLK